MLTPQEIIGGNILPMCRGDSYKFHAAGREDIDVMKICFMFNICLRSANNFLIKINLFFQVRMLGSGRPFLFEIQNAREVPSELLVKEIESKINSLENKLVSQM